MGSIRKGNCPKCGAGPRKIEIWNTLHRNGKRVVWLKCSACYQQFNPPKPVKRVIPMSEIYAAVDVLASYNKWRRCKEIDIIMKNRVREKSSNKKPNAKADLPGAGDKSDVK
jgi:hypothetical protein